MQRLEISLSVSFLLKHRLFGIYSTSSWPLNWVNYPDYHHCIICDKKQLQNYFQINQDFVGQFELFLFLFLFRNYEKLPFFLAAILPSITAIIPLHFPILLFYYTIQSVLLTLRISHIFIFYCLYCWLWVCINSLGCC